MIAEEIGYVSGTAKMEGIGPYEQNRYCRGGIASLPYFLNPIFSLSPHFFWAAFSPKDFP